MINFRCPKCQDWLSVSISRQGQTETCPSCGNVAVVPIHGEPGTPDVAPGMSLNTSEDAKKPPMPPVIRWGLGLYIASSALAFLAGSLTGMSGGIDEEQLAGGTTGGGCFVLLVLAADILGVVMACLGHAWGAVWQIFTRGLTAIPLFLDLGASASLLSSHPVFLIALPASIGSVVFFVLPSAWPYYGACAASRQSQQHAT